MWVPALGGGGAQRSEEAGGVALGGGFPGVGADYRCPLGQIIGTDPSRTRAGYSPQRSEEAGAGSFLVAASFAALSPPGGRAAEFAAAGKHCSRSEEANGKRFGLGSGAGPGPGPGPGTQSVPTP